MRHNIFYSEGSPLVVGSPVRSSSKLFVRTETHTDTVSANGRLRVTRNWVGVDPLTIQIWAAHHFRLTLTDIEKVRDHLWTCLESHQAAKVYEFEGVQYATILGEGSSSTKAEHAGHALDVISQFISSPPFLFWTLPHLLCRAKAFLNDEAHVMTQEGDELILSSTADIVATYCLKELCVNEVRGRLFQDLQRGPDGL